MPETLSSQDVVRWTRELNYGTWRFQKNWNPLHIVDAEGCYFIDVDGRRYLDFSAQLMCVNLGHKNPAVIRAIQEQARTLPYIAPGLRHGCAGGTQPAAGGGAAARPGQVLLHNIGHRGERSGLQDCAHVHGPHQDHRALPVVSRIDHGFDRSNRGSAPLARRAGR